MKNSSPAANWKTWSVVVIFAAAMAWVESAVVFYLRTHIDRIEPYQANPLPIVGGFGFAELMREFATLVMLFTVGWLAGRTWRSRAGYAHRFWRVGYFLLRLPKGHVWLAEFIAGLGYPVLVAAAMVGAGSGSRTNRDADDRMGKFCCFV